jgi:hypothetical protein
MSSGHRRIAGLCAALALGAGCATAPQQKDYSKFVSARPKSILVVPVVNQTVDVTAADYFLSTIPIPLAERGYYVFPVNLVKRVLEDDGLADAALVHSADPAKLAGLFGADAILYVTVERWDAQYVVLSTKVTVELTYTLKDGRTGELLWTDRERTVYTSDSGAGNNGLASLLVAVVSAAATKAAPDYLPLARAANAKAMTYPGPGFPAGPYRPEHGKDLSF